jgi:hypothetical protein
MAIMIACAKNHSGEILMRALSIFCLLTLLGGVQALPATAADLAPAAAPAQSAQSDADACIDVEVNGQHSQSFACLTQKLKPTPSPQAGDPANTMTASEEIAHRPSNQIGLFNYSATSHRMGNQFGVSVFPQRPAPLPPPAGLFPH